MAGNALLVLKVITDAKDAAKGLDETSDSVGKFQSGMAKAGAAAAVAGGAVLAFGLDAAKAAAEDAKGQAILATALKNSTGARSSDIASVEDWISKTAAATGVADDQLRPALATLARSTGDVAKSQAAMGVAMDVSAATGKDLGSVSDALAKGFAGNTASLGKLVPGLDKATVASGDMNKIMAELARTTGGSAAEAANTTEGKMQRMKLAMDETKESIGAALLPALTVLANLLLQVSTWAQDNTTVFLIMMGVVATLAVGVGVLSLAMKVHAAVTTLLTAENWALVASILANPITWIVVGIVALIAVIVVVATKTQFFQTVWDTAFKAVSDIIQSVYGWIKQNWPLLLAILTGPIGLAVLFIVNHFDDITGAAKAVWNFLSGAFTTVWDSVKNTATTALGFILAPINAIKAAFDAVVGAIKSVIDWISKIKIPDIGGIVSKLNPFSAPSPSAPTAAAFSPALRGASRATSSGVTTSGGIHIQVNVPPTANPVEVGREIVNVIRQFERTAGNNWRTA